MEPDNSYEMQEREPKREKKGGAMSPWLSRSGSPTVPTGIDWSSPMSAFRSAWTMLAYAPQGTLLRVAIGAAIGVHGLMLGASIMSKQQGDSAQGEVVFNSRVNARDAAGMELGGRKPMDALLTGYKTLLRDGPSGTGGEGADGKSAEGADGEGADGEGADGEGADGEADGTAGAMDASAGMEEAMRAAMDTAGGGKSGGGVSAFGKPAFTKLASNLGGSGSSSARFSAPALGGASGGGKNAAGDKAAARGATSMRAGGKTIAKSPVRQRGSLNQLKFANDKSQRGLGAKTQGAGYEAASNAFEQQTGGSGIGTPIGGSGAGVGGADTAATPTNLKGDSLDSKQIEPAETCRSGFYLTPDGCVYVGNKNVTPWQSALQRAKWSLVGAGIAFAFALFMWKWVATKVPPGPWHTAILVSAGIAAAIGAGLLINAIVVANQIEDKYGQTLQKESVVDQGLRRSVQGKQLEQGPSQLEDASKLRDHGGAAGKFGF
ncbi:MAG: hypothetical protein ABIJ96_08740 [Elusimicrobiota bacterium]